MNRKSFPVDRKFPNFLCSLVWNLKGRKEIIISNFGFIIQAMLAVKGQNLFLFFFQNKKTPAGNKLYKVSIFKLFIDF